MNRTRTLLASPIGAGMILALLFLAVLTVSGCAEPVAIAAVPPTATVYAPPPTETPPAPPGPTPAALVFPLAAPTTEPAEIGDDQTCVDCHKDEGTLKDTVEEEEVAESLSEGEG